MQRENMTARQIRILDCALDLFAYDGFDKTSTATIAKKAEVSEGLIFRHFKSKQHLLEILLEECEERLDVLFRPVILETDPKSTIRKAIENPFKIPKEEYAYWRLRYFIRWNKDFHRPFRGRVFIDKMSWALQELNYENSKSEGQILYFVLEALAANILLHGKEEYIATKEHLLKKYGV